MEQKMNITVKGNEEIMRGVYANNLMIATMQEEFALDFINLVPPHAFITSRIIISPAHMKRMMRAMQDSLTKYEAIHGEIKEAPVPEQMKQ